MSDLSITIRERAVMCLFHLDKWRQEDIAEALRIDRRTVDRIIVRVGGMLQDAQLDVRELVQQVKGLRREHD